ncbi:MAG: RidA family protein [Limnochordia bacterium]
MSIEAKLQEMELQLPEFKPSAHPLLPGRISGNLIFSSGAVARKEGKLVHPGIVGRDVSLEQAQEAAVVATLNCLANIKAVVGDLDRVSKIIKINGFVASDPSFVQQAQVINAVSQLLIDLWGENGQHARTALGVAALPGGTPVEVEIIAEFK